MEIKKVKKKASFDKSTKHIQVHGTEKLEKNLKILEKVDVFDTILIKIKEIQQEIKENIKLKKEFDIKISERKAIQCVKNLLNFDLDMKLKHLKFE